MIAFSLAILFALGASASSKRWDAPLNQCQITIEDYRFNLCPLINERLISGQVDLILYYETPTTITTTVYNISLNGPLRKSDAIPDNEQCVSGTWACVTIRKHHPGINLGNGDSGAQAIPIVIEAPQSDPKLDSSVGYKEDLGIYAELRESVEGRFPLLSLHMHGGYYIDVPQSVRIDFECAETDEDAPNLSEVGNGTHVLTWATKHACAQVYRTALGDDGESDTPAEDEEPDDVPEDVEEPPANQDLLFPPVPPRENGPSITTIIVCSGAALLGLGYLAIRPPAVLRRYIRATRRARFLRGTGEAKILRWAAEEIEMLDGDEYEADEMVNSRPLPDEEIPLRQSRTRPTFVNYGTAH